MLPEYQIAAAAAGCCAGALGAEHVLDAIRKSSAVRAGAAIVLAGGFGESGDQGRAREAEIKHAADAMRMLGPNSIGLINVTDGVALTASNALVVDELSRGSIALVSQSGGILGALLSRARGAGDRLFQIDRDRQRMRPRRR